MDPVMRAVLNITKKNYGEYKYYFSLWVSNTKKRLYFKSIKRRLLVTPISDNGPTKRDHVEQMDRIIYGYSHVWDDSKHNNSKSGDLFAYIWNQKKEKGSSEKTEGKIEVFIIKHVYSPKCRLVTWSDNVGQGDRNVIELTKKCIYSGNLNEFKKIVGYSDKWNCQGTMQVSESKTKCYIQHIINKLY